MKKTVRVIGIVAVLFSSVVVLSSWKGDSTPITDGGKWEAPASTDNLKNPYADNAEATAAGKKLYKQMCAICHGNKGKGDGIAGMGLTPRPADFSLAEIQEQSDGALYWKMTEGRAPMASYKDALKEEQRWQLVNYLRTLKK